MKFISQWITTHTFADLQPVNLFRKELSPHKAEPGPVQNDHVHFRKKLYLAPAQKVMIRISADDYYKLYINGVFVAQGPATAYAERYRYNELDITDFVRPGENVFAVHVYYQGLINHVWFSGDNRQGMIADIYADGVYIGGTDATWHYGQAREFSGEPIGYKTQFLEYIDFRKKDRDWKRGDFREDGYRNAVIKTDDDHIFQETPEPCIQVYTMKPKQLTRLGPGKWFLDFGSEIVGQFYAKFRGEPGQTVQILCGEETEAEDPQAARYRMRCNCNYQEVCTLSGDEDELEFYDYKGFRYVNVVTDRDNLDSDSFCAVVRHCRFEEKCELRSDVPWVEEIWKLCANSLKWGVQEDYLDCPTREKGQYLGDFTVTGLAHMYLTGNTQMYRKTLMDFAATKRVCPGLLAVASGSLMQEIADFSLQYPMQVLHYYRYTGDMQTLKELYPVICGILDYFGAYEREDGLIEFVDEKWNLVDWPSNLRDGYALQGREHDPKPLHNVLNAHYIGALETLQEIKRILGIPVTDKVEKRKESFLNAFYDPDRKLFCDTPEKTHCALHSNVLPAFYGIAPEEAWQTIGALIKEKGFSCGTHFSYFVLKAMGRIGTREEQLQLLVNESEHSWVNMLREGATTCFEAWGKDQKVNTSLCHPWSCAPIVILIEDILKADPTAFGKDGITLLELDL